MTDLFDAKIVCDNCDRTAEKGVADRDGFRIRIAKCPECSKIWTHPGDMAEFEQFQKLKNKDFHVKLRMVGNSWAVSIPREIIEFHEEMEKEMKKQIQQMERMVRLSFERPGRIAMFFNEERDEED